MKFVGSIKGKHFLIDPETYEAEIREKIAQEIEQYTMIFSERKKAKEDSLCLSIIPKEAAARIARGQK